MAPALLTELEMRNIEDPTSPQQRSALSRVRGLLVGVAVVGAALSSRHVLWSSPSNTISTNSAASSSSSPSASDLADFSRERLERLERKSAKEEASSTAPGSSAVDDPAERSPPSSSTSRTSASSSSESSWLAEAETWRAAADRERGAPTTSVVGDTVATVSTNWNESTMAAAGETPTALAVGDAVITVSSNLTVASVRENATVSATAAADALDEDDEIEDAIEVDEESADDEEDGEYWSRAIDGTDLLQFPAVREFLGYHGLDASTPRVTLQNYLPGSLVLKSWPKRMRSSLGAAAGTGCVRRLPLDRPYADKQNGDES